MDFIKIAIIGAGNLGSRHLQSLAELKYKADIYIVDPNQQSLATAKERYQSVLNGIQDVHNVSYFTTINNLPKKLDFVIIATSSDVRKSVIQEVLSGISLNYLILEKFLFPELDGYLEIQDLIKEKNIKCWVNCGRRAFPIYKEIKKEIRDSRRVRFQVSGSLWGLGCNAIHFLDLFAFLTDEYDLKLDNSQLNEEVINSKRQGFIEFTGSILGKSLDDRVQFEITSYFNGSTPINIMIDSDRSRFWVKENEGEIISSLKEEKWVSKINEFYIPQQSEMTHIVIEQIISSDKCDLPTYEESSHLHQLLLQTFLNHLNKNSMEEVEKCLIT